MLDEKILHQPSADFAYELRCPSCREYQLRKEKLTDGIRCPCGFLWSGKAYTRLIPLALLSRDCQPPKHVIVNG